MRLFRKRVREIGPKYSSLSGLFISRKQNSKIIQFESSLERDFIYLLEFDPEVYIYLEQPISIKYTDAIGKNHSYIPDFLIRYRDQNRKDTLVEIKYEEEAIRNKLINSEKTIKTHEFCKKNNLNFSIITEKEIRFSDPNYLSNIKFLSSYRDELEILEKNGHVVDSSDILLLLQKLRELKKCSINQLVGALSSEDYKRGELIYYTWYLIANRFIKCDLTQSLNLNTVIWIF